MLTPVDIQNKNFKGGIGFDKKDVEAFMNDLSSDYSMLYRSNVELNDKVKTLSESLQHYKSIEDSMQKALTISEKTSEETINAASDKARQITTEAELKAETMLADAKQELEDIKNEIYRLKQQKELFKEQFGKILNAQLKMLDGEVVDIDLGSDFEPNQSYNSGKDSFGGGLGSEGGLGEGGLGGGYTGSNPSNFEKTAQSPTFDRGSNLGTDPFADAANGGGRFSRQTGGDYTGASKNKKSKSSGKSTTSLNIKSSKSNTVHRGSAVAAAMAAKSGSDTEDKKVEPIKQTIPNVAKDDNKESIVKDNASNNSVSKDSVSKDAVYNDKSAKDNVSKDNVLNDKNTKDNSNKKSQDKPFKNKSIFSKVEAIKESGKEAIKEAIKEPKREPKKEPVVEKEPEINKVPENEPESKDTTPAPQSAISQRIAAQKAVDEQIKSAVESIQKVMNRPSEEVEEESPEVSINADIINEFLDKKYEDSNSKSDEADDNEPLSGDVENKVNESNMLDSDDNHFDGFDFLSDDNDDDTVTDTSDKDNAVNDDKESDNNDSVNEEPENVKGENEDLDDDEPLSGEVENKVNESNMIDSEDNHSDGFDFLAGNEEDEDEIPTIQTEVERIKAAMNRLNNNYNDDDDVFTGDVESRVKVKESHMIGNDDDDNDGFSFM